MDRAEGIRAAGGSAFATGDIDAARRQMAGVFRSHRLGFAGRPGPFAMRHEALHAGRLSVHWLRYGGRVVMTAPEMDRFYLFQINLSGSCEIALGQERAVVGAGAGYAVDPGRPLAKTWDEACEQMILRVDRDVLEQFAGAEIGRDVRGRLAFPFRALPMAAGPAALVELAAALRGDALGLRRGLAHHRVSAHLEPAILALLLSAFPHSLQHDYDRAADPCAPYYVRRAEQYIEAHLRDPIGIDDLVAAAGVGMRSLFGGFRRFRSTTPMAYVKAARLDLARAELARAAPGRDSVTDIAIACGFTHMSKFARDFKARFGVSPSAALGRRL